MRSNAFIPRRLKHFRMVTPVASHSNRRLLCSGDPSTLQFVTKSVNLVAKEYRYSHRRLGARSAKHAWESPHRSTLDVSTHDKRTTPQGLDLGIQTSPVQLTIQRHFNHSPATVKYCKSSDRAVLLQRDTCPHMMRVTLDWTSLSLKHLGSRRVTQVH